MQTVCLFIILAWNCWKDMHARKILIIPNLFFLAIGFLWTLLGTGESMRYAAAGMLPGGFLCLVSLLTRGAVGMGDALLLLITGSFLGLRESMLLLFISWVAAGVWAGILLVFFKAQRKTEIPFAPFLLLAYLGLTILNLVETG